MFFHQLSTQLNLIFLLIVYGKVHQSSNQQFYNLMNQSIIFVELNKMHHQKVLLVKLLLNHQSMQFNNFQHHFLPKSKCLLDISLVKIEMVSK